MKNIILVLFVFSLNFPMSRFIPNNLEILFIISIFVLIISKDKINFENPLRIMLLFFVYVLLNFIILSDTALHLNYLVEYFNAFLILFFVLNNLSTTKQLKLISNTWIISNVCLIFLGVYEGVSGLYLEYNSELNINFNENLIRYIPYDYDPNYMQIQFPFALLISFHYYKKEERIYKTLYLIAFFIIVLGYILTVSKMGILTIILLFPFFLKEMFVFRIFRKHIFYYIAIFFILISFIKIDFSFLNYNFERYGSLKSSNIDEVTNYRSSLFKETLNVFFDSPFFGSGVGNTNKHLGSKFNNLISTTHNSFLHILSEIGIVGFLLYLWLIYSCIMLSKNYKLNIFQKILIVTILPLSSVTAGMSYVFWFIAGVCFKFKRLNPSND